MRRLYELVERQAKLRLEYSEGYAADDICFPVRVFSLLGIKAVVCTCGQRGVKYVLTLVPVTNAAGGLDPSLHEGDIVLLKDHLSLPGLVRQFATFSSDPD